MAKRSGTGVLLGIALFKLVKAVLLIAVGIAALSVFNGSEAFVKLRHSAQEIGLDPNHHLVNGAIGKVSGLDHKRLEALSVGTFVYAAVFLVEGAGLILRKRWAEYLTVVVTASFIPFEIYEIAHKPSVLKVFGLALNAAIVLYLVLRLRKERREENA